MSKFLSKSDLQRLKDAVATSEKETSGEIVVSVQKKLGEDPNETAKKFFEEKGLTNTKDRNGILIMIGYKDQQLVILGDEGINEKVPPKFWDEIILLMVDHFKDNNYAKGLEKAILQVGQQLKEYFPHQSDDVNELPDDIHVE
ncbi:MAG: TPM domain-containing protein [Lentisphaeria bacterium]|nr:TPM domain-containing protein [Lentisphaeria bacterium]